MLTPHSLASLAFAALLAAAPTASPWQSIDQITTTVGRLNVHPPSRAETTNLLLSMKGDGLVQVDINVSPIRFRAATFDELRFARLAKVQAAISTATLQ